MVYFFQFDHILIAIQFAFTGPAMVADHVFFLAAVECFRSDDCVLAYLSTTYQYHGLIGNFTADQIFDFRFAIQDLFSQGL
ncbi:hypothetical protein ABE545_20235 [Sphingobacterium faecium]|uniref:hypothetical protein n=1 Tax=Sphingobacterium faecium TaxID=34087 RepID=UPI00320B9D89